MWQVYLLATDKPSACLTLVQPRTPGLQYFVAHHQASLLLLTNHGSKQDYQVMTAPLSSPGISNWQTAVPHRSHTAITDIDVFATHAVLYERQQGRPAISLLPLPVDHHRQAPTHLAAASKHQTASSSSRGLAREDNQLDDSSTECSGLSTCNSVHKLAGTSTNFCSYAKQAKSLAHCAVTDAVTAQAHNGLSPMQQVQSYAVESHAQQGTAALHSTTLPKWVMALEPGGNPDYHSGTVRLHLSSPVHPQHVYDCHLESGGLELLGTQQVAGHNPEDYVCSMHHAVSPDGTEVNRVAATPQALCAVVQ